MLNWNRINRKYIFFLIHFFLEIICFNYLQQRFYLVKHTMESLAKGTNSDCIYKLLKVTINTQQQIFQEAMKDTSAIEDIAEKLESKKSLFSEEEDDVKIRSKKNPDNYLND